MFFYRVSGRPGIALLSVPLPAESFSLPQNSKKQQTKWAS